MKHQKLQHLRHFTPFKVFSLPRIASIKLLCRIDVNCKVGPIPLFISMCISVPERAERRNAYMTPASASIAEIDGVIPAYHQISIANMVLDYTSTKYNHARLASVRCKAVDLSYVLREEFGGYKGREHQGGAHKDWCVAQRRALTTSCRRTLCNVYNQPWISIGMKIDHVSQRPVCERRTKYGDAVLHSAA